MVSGVEAGDLPLVEVPPTKPCHYWQGNHDEQNLSQGSLGCRAQLNSNTPERQYERYQS
jgi:hypothetical protein